MADDPVVEMVHDPDFAKLNPQQQRQALSAHDPDFANLDDNGLQQFVQAHANAKQTFPITPREGESFADTMNRGAEAGKSVTPEQIKSQTIKGLKEAPVVLAAAPAMGLAGAAGLRSATFATKAAIDFASSEAGKDMIKLVLKYTGEKLLQGGAVGVGYGVIHEAAKLLGLAEK